MNTCDSFEHKVAVNMRWQKMKMVEDNGRTMKNIFINIEKFTIYTYLTMNVTCSFKVSI